MARFLFDAAQEEIGALPIEATGVEQAYVGSVQLDSQDQDLGFFVGSTRCVFVAVGDEVVWGNG